jgi:hypothetical protein
MQIGKSALLLNFFLLHLVDRFRLPRHVIHQQILAQRIRRGEVSLPAAHLRDFLNELNQAVVRGEHKSVDHHAGALAL